MAKKTTVKKSPGELPDPMKSFMAIDPEAEIVANANTTTAEFISTGSYALDAAISGRLLGGGVPSNKMTLFTGSSQTGKTFLVANVAAQATKQGYSILWIDSEGATDATTLNRIGVDINKVIIRQCDTIQSATHIILQLIDMLNKEEEEYGTHNKWMVVVDSLANLSSVKEREDLLKINPADGTAIPRDMSKAQAMKSLFRCVTTPLSKLQVPLVCITHIYANIMNPYAGNSISGGSGVEYNASVIVELSRSKLDDKITNKKAEESVNSGDLTRTGILVTAKIIKSRFTIPRKIRLIISYFAPMRPSFFLESYINWDNAQIGRGSIITEKEYEKLSPVDKDKVKIFDYKGQKSYALLKDTARTIAVGRKNMTIPISEFLTPKVFDQEFLEYMDENIIRPIFELPSQDKLKEIDDIETALELEGE